jgi:hypothetical protein
MVESVKDLIHAFTTLLYGKEVYFIMILLCLIIAISGLFIFNFIFSFLGLILFITGSNLFLMLFFLGVKK